MMQFARNFSGLSSVTSIFSLVAAAGLAVISLCYNRILVAQEPIAGRCNFTSLFFTFRRSVIETTDGEQIHRRDGSEQAVQSKIGERLPKSLQYLNCISKERGRPIYPLRTATSRDAAGFAMRGR
jgi:hypothetical protein